MVYSSVEVTVCDRSHREEPIKSRAIDGTGKSTNDRRIKHAKSPTMMLDQERRACRACNYCSPEREHLILLSDDADALFVDQQTIADARIGNGFMEQPEVALALELCGPEGLQLEPMDVSYFLSREKLVPGPHVEGLALLRGRVFAAMARNAGSITDYFNIPTNRVVELGTRVEL
jgi:hypothetical protein